MSDIDGGQHVRTDDEAGWYAAAPGRPLATAAWSGLAVSVVLLVVSGLWWRHLERTLGASPWGPVVSLVLAVVVLCWSGLAAIAHWACAQLLASRREVPRP